MRNLWVGVLISVILNSITLSGFSQAKFEPPDGKALLIIGQDNNAIGGMPSIGYTDGYMDHVGGPVPSGFTQYTSINYLEGLTSNIQICTGHDYAQHVMDNWDNTVLHLSVYAVNMLSGVVNGQYDGNIDVLANFCKAQAPRPIFFRWAFEFAFQYGGEQASYIAAWQRVHDRFEVLGVDNVAWVWAAAWGDFSNWGQISGFYPGDDYVDWFGYSQWTHDRVGRFMIEEAARRDKPCMIAESCYYNHTITSSPGGDGDWNTYYQPTFDLFTEYSNLKAYCYINSNWETLGCWGGWGDSRIQNNSYIKSQWLGEIESDFWLKQSSDLYNILNGEYSDCNGVDGGSAYLDNCNNCVGGNTGLSPCLAAEFNASATSSIVGQNITFTDVSQGDVSSYSWDFGSGASVSTASSVGPHVVSYSTSGTKTISLTIGDGSATDTYTLQLSIAENTTPYGGAPAAIPGKVECEDYDSDGAGVSYNDNDIGNEGGAYRSDDVDIGAGNGTYVVAWTESGEWLIYTVNVQTTGIYSIEIPVATVNSSKILDIEMNGSSIASSISIPNTGDWESYQTVSVSDVLLTAGDYQLLKIYPNGYNIDYLNFSLVSATDCNGDAGGSAYMDNCNICVGGNSGNTACEQDCNEVYGGSAYLDDCNNCVGGSTGTEACTVDVVGEIANNPINVYPNPFKDNFIVQNATGKPYVIKVVDLGGVEVYTKNQQSGQVAYFGQEWGAGVYIGQFIIGEKIFYKKIIKE